MSLDTPFGPRQIEALVYRLTDALARAHQFGTLNALDRSRQYEDMNQAQQLRAINEAWAKIRNLEIERDKAVAARRREHTRNMLLTGGLSALTAIITALAWEGAKSLAPHLMEFLGR